MIFQTSKYTRSILENLLNKLTPKQLYFIPKGFKNHILWNIAHILVTEQLLIYKLSGLDINMDNKFVNLYGKGSTPKTKISLTEIDEIKEQLIPLIEKTEKDFKNGTFKNFIEYPTSTGIVLRSLDDTFKFNNYHEGIHLGIILSIKKLL